MDHLKDEDLWTLLHTLTSHSPQLSPLLSPLSKRIHKAIHQTILSPSSATLTSKTVVRTKNPASTGTGSGWGRRLDAYLGYGGGGVWVEGWFDERKGEKDGEGFREGLWRGRWEDVSSGMRDHSTLLSPFTHLSIHQSLHPAPPDSITPPTPIKLLPLNGTQNLPPGLIRLPPGLDLSHIPNGSTLMNGNHQHSLPMTPSVSHESMLNENGNANGNGKIDWLSAAGYGYGCPPPSTIPTTIPTVAPIVTSTSTKVSKHTRTNSKSTNNTPIDTHTRSSSMHSPVSAVVGAIGGQKLTEEQRMLQEQQLGEILAGGLRLERVEMRSAMGLRNEIWGAITSLPNLTRLSIIPPIPHPAYASLSYASQSSGSSGTPSIPRYNPFFLEQPLDRKGLEGERRSLVQKLKELKVGNLGMVGSRNLTRHLHTLSMHTQPPPLRILHISTLFMDAALCTSIAELGSAGHLEELVLSTLGTKLFDAGLKEIVENCVGLKRFGLKEVQGRMTKNAWKEIENWPTGLTEITIELDERGSHHTWSLDHLQSIQHLPFDQLESLVVKRTSPALCKMPFKPRNLHTPEVHESCIVQMIPRDLIILLAEGKAPQKLKALDLSWWKVDENTVSGIVKGCPGLERLGLQIEFSWSKLLNLTALYSLTDLEEISASLVPAGKTVLEVKSNKPSSKTARLPKVGSVDIAAGEGMCIVEDKLSGLPAYLAEKIRQPDPTDLAEEKVKKFARRFGKLGKLDLVGKGTWTIIRPRFGVEKDKKGQLVLSAEFVHCAWAYLEAWELGEGQAPEWAYEDPGSQVVISDISQEEEQQIKKAHTAPPKVALPLAPTPAEKHQAVAEWTLTAAEFPDLASKTSTASASPSAHHSSPASHVRGGKGGFGGRASKSTTPPEKSIYKKSVLAGLASGTGPAGFPDQPRSGRSKPVQGSRAVLKAANAANAASLAAAAKGGSDGGTSTFPATAGEYGRGAGVKVSTGVVSPNATSPRSAHNMPVTPASATAITGKGSSAKPTPTPPSSARRSSHASGSGSTTNTATTAPSYAISNGSRHSTNPKTIPVNSAYLDSSQHQQMMITTAGTTNPSSSATGAGAGAGNPIGIGTGSGKRINPTLTTIPTSTSTFPTPAGQTKPTPAPMTLNKIMTVVGTNSSGSTAKQGGGGGRKKSIINKIQQKQAQRASVPGSGVGI